MAKRVHTSAFEDMDQVTFAAKIFTFWLGDRKTAVHPTDLLANIFGHDRYMQLRNASGSWALWNDRYTPDKHRKLADRMAKATGSTSAEAWEVLDLMNLRNAPLDLDRVLGQAAAYFQGSTVEEEAMRLFKGYPFLLPDLDRALRLRKAGKTEIGIDDAAEAGNADILDAVHTIASTQKAPLWMLDMVGVAAVYYAQATDWTAMQDGGPFEMFDPMPELLSPGDSMTRLTGMMVVAREFRSSVPLDHRALRDIVRATHFPIPENDEELAAAAATHRRLRPIAIERFGYLHPFDMLDEDDWNGSWRELDAVTQSPQYHEEALAAGFQRIADFVDGYTAQEDDGAPMETGAISYRGYGFRKLSDLCVTLRDMPDTGLADYLENGGTRVWESEDDVSVADAVKNFREGKPKLVRSPAQEDNDPDWKRDPELRKMADQMMQIVRR